MTLESTINKNRYIGNGATTQFPFTFKIWKTDQILVYIGDGTTEQEVSAQCTVSITASGGTVTFPTAPSNGTIIVLRRNMSYIQEDDYRNGTRFDSEEVEDRFDMDCAERQDLRLDVDRAVKVPLTSSKTPDGLWQDLVGMAHSMEESRDMVRDWIAAIGTDAVGTQTPVVADGTSSPRTLGSRFADWLTVRDFGAKGDGSTDDTAAFEACISYASQEGSPKIIDLCGGTYVVSKTIEIASDDITLRNGRIVADEYGEWFANPSDEDLPVYPTINKQVHVGNRYVVYEYTALPVFQMTGKRICFENIQIECTSVASGLNNSGFMTMYSNVTVEHMGSNGYGILVELDGNQTRLDNCSIHQVNYSENNEYDPESFSSDGFVNSCGDVIINNCVFWLCRINYLHYAIGPVQATNLHLWQDGYKEVGDSEEDDFKLKPNAVFYAGNSSLFNNLYLDNGEMVFSDVTRIVLNTCYALRNFDRIPSDYIPFRFITTSANRSLYGFKVSNLHYLYDDTHGNQMFCFETEGNNASWVAGIENLASVQDLDCTSWFGAKTVVNNHSANKEVLKLFHLTGNECQLQMRAKGEGNAKFHARIIDNSEGLALAVKDPSVQVFQVLNTPDGNCTAKLIGRYETGQTSGLIMCNSTGTKTASLRMATDDGSGSPFFRFTLGGVDTADVNSFGINPRADNALNLGSGDKRWKNVYAGTGSIQTSDERLKQQVGNIPEEILQAWGDVDFVCFKFNDAVEEKGESARIHTGVIAQRISDAFEARGLDASKYGLFCYDEWEDKYEEQEVVDAEAVVDDEGTVIEPARTHIERNLVQPAGSRFGVRYEEALALECAYQRRRLDLLEERVNQITNNSNA